LTTLRLDDEPSDLKTFGLYDVMTGPLAGLPPVC
jgi:hypothetical protein